MRRGSPTSAGDGHLPDEVQRFPGVVLALGTLDGTWRQHARTAAAGSDGPFGVSPLDSEGLTCRGRGR